MEKKTTKQLQKIKIGIHTACGTSTKARILVVMQELLSYQNSIV